MPVLRRANPFMSLVTVEDISVAYGADTVLAHVSLTVEPGEIVTIVGPNGFYRPIQVPNDCLGAG